jgi:hypothetical protein
MARRVRNDDYSSATYRDRKLEEEEEERWAQHAGQAVVTTFQIRKYVKLLKRKNGRVPLVCWLNLWRKRQPIYTVVRGLGRDASWTWDTPMTPPTLVWHTCDISLTKYLGGELLGSKNRMKLIRN